MTRTQLKNRPKKYSVSQVLIITPEEQILVNRQEQHRPIKLGTDKIKGGLHVVDLSGTVETTYVSLENFAEQEVEDAIRLDPREYLPHDAPEPLDLLIGVTATQNDQENSAALIAYAPKVSVNQLVANLGANPVLIEPGLTVMAQDYLSQQKNAVVLEINEGVITGLLVLEGKVRNRLRELASTVQLTDQAISVASSLSSLAEDVMHVGLTGHPLYCQNIAEQLEQKGAQVKVYDVTELASAALRQAPLVIIQPEIVRKQNPYLPLGLGLVAAVLPGLLLTALNSKLQGQIDQARHETERLRPQVTEADQLTREIENFRAIQAQAKAITDNRVNWIDSLTQLTKQLPVEPQSEDYNVRLKTLNASISNPPVSSPPPTPNAPPPDPNAQATTAPVAPVTPTLTPPLLTYDLDMQAISRDAATQAITSFERTYNFQLSKLNRNENNTWDITATALEKSTPERP